MSLDFLRAIAPIATTGMQLYSAFRGRDAEDEIPTLGPQLQGLRDARTYEQAAINPASPHHRALAALDEAEIKRDLIATVNEVIKQNNRARARGVVGFGVNPERRDESRTASIADLFARAGDASRRGASDKLNRAAEGARGTSRGYDSINQIFQRYGDADNQSMQGGIQALGKTVPNLLKLIEEFLPSGGGSPLTLGGSQGPMGIPSGPLPKSIFIGKTKP